MIFGLEVCKRYERIRGNKKGVRAKRRAKLCSSGTKDPNLNHRIPLYNLDILLSYQGIRCYCKLQFGSCSQCTFVHRARALGCYRIDVWTSFLHHKPAYNWSIETTLPSHHHGPVFLQIKGRQNGQITSNWLVN